MLHSYPWYITDWRESEAVLAMTAEQRDVYRNLLDMCWRDGSLPTDEKALRAMSLADEKEWRRSKAVVLRLFEQHEGRLYNNKIDEKRPAVIRYQEARQRGAELTNEKRRARRSADADCDAERDGDRYAERTLSDTPSDTLSGRSANATRARPPAPTPTLPSLTLRSETASSSDTPEPSGEPTTPPRPKPKSETAKLRQMPEPAKPPDIEHVRETLRALTRIPDAPMSYPPRFEPDDSVVLKLWASCRAADPKCTEPEVRAMVFQRLANWEKRGIKNPFGAAVALAPDEFRSGGSTALRAFRASATEEHRAVDVRQSTGETA